MAGVVPAAEHLVTDLAARPVDVTDDDLRIFDDHLTADCTSVVRERASGVGEAYGIDGAAIPVHVLIRTKKMLVGCRTSQRLSEGQMIATG